MLLAGNAVHADVSPDGTGSGVYGSLLSMLAQTHGFPCRLAAPDTWSTHWRIGCVLPGELSARMLRSTGCGLLSGCATGVRCGQAERYRRLGPSSPTYRHRRSTGDWSARNTCRRVSSRICASSSGISNVEDQLTVSRPIPWIAQPARLAGTVHLGVDVDGIVDFAADLATGGASSPVRFARADDHRRSDPLSSRSGSAWGYTHLPFGLELDTGRLQAHVDVSSGARTARSGLPSRDRRRSVQHQATSSRPIPTCWEERSTAARPNSISS